MCTTRAVAVAMKPLLDTQRSGRARVGAGSSSAIGRALIAGRKRALAFRLGGSGGAKWGNGGRGWAEEKFDAFACIF